MTTNEIDEQIAKLKSQRAEIERREREQAEVERKKKEKECEKDLQGIQEMIDEFNKKYDKEITLATTYKLGDDWSKFTLLPPFLRGLI
jgi:sugar-specific transcriptional regulator TrmB